MEERGGGIKGVFWSSDEKRLRTLFRVPVMFGLILFAVQLIVGMTGLVTSVVPVPGPLETALIFGLVIVAVAALTWFIDRRHLRDIGLSNDRDWWLDLLVGLAVGVGMVAVVVGALRVGGYASFERTAVTSPDLTLGGGATGVVYGLLFFGAVGFLEELLVRGYLLVNIAEGIRGTVGTARNAIAVAIVTTAGIFGVLHAANPGGTTLSLLNISLAGLFFGGVYAVTGRLAFPIGLHISWNFSLGPLFGLPVSGLTTDTALVGVTLDGPTVLTGGAFGPEGGLVMLVALAFGIGSFLLWIRQRQGQLAVDERIAIPDLWTRDDPSS